MLLADEETARQRIRDQLMSKDWWMFILPRGIPDFVEHLEEEFYSGERNADFHLITGSVGAHFLCFCLAHKKWASPEVMAQLLEDAGRAGGNLHQRDIIAVVSSDSDVEAANAVYHWLKDRPGEPEIPQLGVGTPN
jgi:hypothetical protein